MLRCLGKNIFLLQSVSLFAGLFQDLECLVYGGTRSHSKAFIEIRANYEQYKNSFLPRTIKDWNALPTHLVHVTSVDEFGSRLQSLTT
jgi:hypothetical protein